MIRVTVCNIPIQLNGDVLAAYLSKYSNMEVVIPLKASDGMAHIDWVPIYAQPSFFRLLKLRYSLDIGGLSRDGQVTNELGTGSLKHAVSVLTSKDFRAVVNSE